MLTRVDFKVPSTKEGTLYVQSYVIPYRAKLDEARPCEAFDMRDARMGIPYRAKPDEARPCEAFDMWGA